MSPFVERAAAAAQEPLRPMLLSVTVDFDKSVIVQMALFATLILVLKPLLFEPMLKLFALREEKTDGAKAAARSMQEKAADILARYEAEVAKARGDAATERETLRRETMRLEAAIIDEARKAADTIADEGRAKIAVEVADVRKSLEKQSKAIVDQLSSQILGREVRS